VERLSGKISANQVGGIRRLIAEGVSAESEWSKMFDFYKECLRYFKKG